MRALYRFALATLMTALGATAVFGGERTLRIYTWADYFDPEVIALFESENNCRVLIDYFDSNEAMYAKILAGGGGYDIITPSAYMSGIMRQQDLLAPLDHSLLPNLRHLDRTFTAFTEDPDLSYSIPYTLSVTGVGYNRDHVGPEELGSWDIFANPSFARRMTMLNDMRETIGAALKHLGYSINTTSEEELSEAAALLNIWKRNLAKFEVDEAKMGLASGEFLVIHGYNGDIGMVMNELPEIGFYVPDEGSSFVVDDLVIAASSPNAALAHALVNHMLQPEIAAKNMESILYYMPNPDAVKLLDAELLANPAFNMQSDTLTRCEVIRDLGAENSKYVKVWNMVKSEK